MNLLTTKGFVRCKNFMILFSGSSQLMNSKGTYEQVDYLLRTVYDDKSLQLIVKCFWIITYDKLLNG